SAVHASHLVHFLLSASVSHFVLHSFPTRRSSDLYSAPVSVSQNHSKIHITGGKLSASHAVSPCLFSAGNLTVDSVTGSSQNNAADRKSTRLNSSHVSISYAVFCLKKKKINKNTYT